ncbi:phthiocerol synthesis polyketide synthase type I PpsD isoform X2 [Oryzias melastigma]|uniref:phthiocerol synthesis polyketide synthase type I PpsD isoform X2 n=1 Tax=Oryzias melastigma TaxID=30732 RepID=UPI000CF7BF83|nr:phthiocerol synthesis polyketide synthase type I PpsD isoform X2 [Oryzias melastigma]
MSASQEEAEVLDCSPSGPPDLSDEHGSSDRNRRKRRSDCEREEEEMLCCASCEVVLKHPFSPCCGHLFCRQCITSNREQSALPGHCPKKSRVELKADRGGAEEGHQSVPDERHTGRPADGAEPLIHGEPGRDRTSVHRMEEEDSIAVVGMGCNFPGGEGLENFWKVLEGGRNCSATVPKSRFDLASWHDPDATKVGKSCTEKAALVDGFNDFDNKLFDISDIEAKQMDPQQKQLLQCVYRALEDAGLPMEKASGTRTGVFIGIMNRDYESNGGNIHPSLINHFTGTGLAMSIAANRVSYCFNFTGPSLTLDTACSSSLVALHLACQSIRQGDCEMAVCGGVNFITEPRVFVVLSRAKMISPEGTSKPFSSRADGYGRGEGCGVVLLKPLKKALEDHDNIWGIISKTAVNQDGRTVSPITRPSMTQQEELLRKIYSHSDIANVQYVEAHGTGTPVGDPTEAQSISNVIAKARPCGSEALWIGSVKGNIGHTESAAGIAGAMKVMLMMKHETIVPSVFHSDENCSVDTKSLKIKIPNKTEPWESSRARVAGVNNFGFGGTNAHAIIKQHIPCNFKKKCDERLTKYFVLSASSPKSLTMMTEDTIRHLDAHAEVDLDSLLYTSACRRSHQKHKYRKAIVTSSIADLKEKLCASVDQNVRPALSDPRLVFVYCGNGVNYHGMCKQLLKSEPIFRECIKEISQLFQIHSSLNILNTLESDFERNDFQNPDVVQPLLFAIQVGITTLLRCWGVKPNAVLGHSVGEVAAAHCSGLLSLEEAVKVIYIRSSMQSKVTGGKMLVISNMAVSEVSSLLTKYAGRVSLAAFNSPQSCTLSGDADAIESIHGELRASDSRNTLFLRVLDVPSAYHSHMMDSILPDIRETIGPLQASVPETELYSTVTGKEVQQGDFCTGEYWARNIRDPVVFEEALKVAQKENRNTVFLEVGPRKALQRNIMETLGDNTAVVASVEPQREQESTISVLSKLFELGVAVDWNSFYRGHETIPLPFPKYHFDCSDRDVIIAAAKNNKGSSHPVLCQTGSEDNLFICDLTSDTTFYLKEHKHADVPIVPGAFYVDLGLAAFLAISRPKVPLSSLQISVSFHKPCVLTQNYPEIKVQLTQKENETSFTVFSSSAEYASGSVVSKLEDLIEEPWISLSSIRKRCTSVLNFQQFYSYLSEQGFQYGEVFQNKGDVYYGKDLMEAFAAVSIPEELLPHLHECCIHPVVLDYLIQLLPLTVKHITTDRVGFPAKVGSLTVFQPLQKDMIIYLRATHVGMDHFEVCGCFADMEGRVLVEAKDVMFKDLSNVNIEEYFYHNSFSVVLESSTTSPPPKALVFSDVLGISDDLKQHLDQGSRYVSFTHANHIVNHGFSSLLTNLNITDIEKNFDEALFLWYTEDLPSLKFDVLSQILANCCDVFRQIIVELRKIKFSKAIRVVTYSSSDITVDRISPGFVFAGLTRSFAAEMSDLSFQLVDMEKISPENITALSEVLRQYPCNDFPELVVKDGKIFKPTIIHSPLDVTDRAEGSCISANSKPFILETNDGKRISQLSALQFDKDPGPICNTFVEIKLSKVCVHSSDYFPVSDSHLKSGQTLYWNKHSSQKHKLLALDYSGIIKAVGKDVTTLKVGDHIASCYPIVAADKVRVPESVCYSTETLPFLRETPCVSFLVLSWHILRPVLSISKQNLGILCSEPHAALVDVLTHTSTKLGCNVIVSTHCEDFFDIQLDALVIVPPFDETMTAKIADLSGLQVVVLLCESQVKGVLVQDVFQSVKDGVYVQTVQMQEVLQKGNLSAHGPHVLQWLKSLSLEKKCAPEMNPFQNVKSEAASTCSEGSASYFSSKKLAVVSLQDNVDGNTSDIPVLPTKKQFFTKGAVYIVTGGLSGLGFETVRFISQRGGGNVVSLSRSKPSAEVQQEMCALEKEHENCIISMQCDVSVFEDVHKVIIAIGQKFPGCPIRGVFHSAVVLHDGIIEALNTSLYEKVFKPKVNGVLNLHRATQHCPLDYFVCYSSISAFLGNPSQSNYAAANSFLDMFCHYRRQLGLPGQSISWGALKLGLLDNKEHLQHILEVYGIMGLELAEIRKSLEQCLKLNRAQQAVCRFNFKNISYNVFSHNSSLTKRLYALVEEAIRKSRQGFFQTKKANSIPPREYITTLLSETFGLDKSEMTDESFLSALGMDSMQAMTVQNLILQERRVNLPLVKLLDPAATLSTLVATLTESEMVRNVASSSP